MTCHSELDDTGHQATERVARLVNQAGPLVAGHDDAGLAAILRREWSIGELAGFLNSDDARLAVLAAHCLGVLGGLSAVMPLARALHHDDVTVAAAAENALWRVWFNEGGAWGRRQLMRAADEMNDRRFAAAVAILDEVISRKPTFAEAYNQRGIVRYLQDDYVRSIADCKRALSINRSHFGAAAGMGHCHAHLDQFAEALACYRTALKIHPRMEGIRQSVRKIQGLAFRTRPVA